MRLTGVILGIISNEDSSTEIGVVDDEGSNIKVQSCKNINGFGPTSSSSSSSS